VNIVFVCNEYPPLPHGGIGTFVQTVARALYRRGHRVTVVGSTETPREYSDGGVEVVTLRRNGLPYVGNLITRFKLHRWLSARARAGSIDVIEAPDYMGFLPFRVAGCTTVIRLHLSSTSIRRQAGTKISKGIALYERSTLAANPNWIAVSDYSLQLTSATFRLSPKCSARIYYPVPPCPAALPEVGGLPAEYVLYAGQLSLRKGALILAEAACNFMSGRPDLNLVYVGGGIAANGNRSIPDRVREIMGPELSKRVHFLGHLEREKVLACMARAKVFVLPSRLETLGIVFLEAMSCGTPVVCMKCPPGPEIVEDRVTGLLADPTSSREVGERINRLLDDPKLANELAANGKRMVAERFSLEECVDATQRFYEECIVAARLKSMNAPVTAARKHPGLTD
jgi:glycosyltransferase involved in cell wall biosynthesis